MNMSSSKKLIFVLTVMMFLGIITSYAQPGNPDDVPISGIGYLLALGGAFGIKKIYDLRKK